jgi:hypothetical protein
MAQAFRGRARLGRVSGQTSTGDTGVVLDKGVTDLARQLIESAYPKVGAAVVARLENLESLARGRWPVKTGTSRDSIELETRATEDTLTVQLNVGAWYAGFIKGKGFDKGPAYDLILDPADKIADELQARLAKEIAR